MGKIAAYSTALNIGVCQITSTPIVGTITGSGNATFTITKDGMTGSSLAVVVAVLDLDTPDTVATKAVAQLNITANFTAKCIAWCSGSILYCGVLVADADDGTFNIAYTNTGCTGLTPDATSDVVIAGVEPVATAYVTNISGPALKANIKDVTTHDSTSAYEEAVVTLLDGGDIKMDIVYDPNEATHEAAAGLLYYLKNKILVYGQLVFPGPYTWSFAGYIIEFTTDEPVAGELKAKTTFSVQRAPTLV